jgi:hypothetical protein
MNKLTALKSQLSSVVGAGHFQLWMGVSIAGCGILELIESIEHISEVGEVGGMHGVVLVGALHAIKGVSELIDGTERAKEDIPRFKNPDNHSKI